MNCARTLAKKTRLIDNGQARAVKENTRSGRILSRICWHFVIIRQSLEIFH